MLVRQTVHTVAVQWRMTHWHLAAKLGLSLTTTFHLARPWLLRCVDIQDSNINQGIILWKHSNPLKSILHDALKYCWFLWCPNKVGLFDTRLPKWICQYNRVLLTRIGSGFAKTMQGILSWLTRKFAYNYLEPILDDAEKYCWFLWCPYQVFAVDTRLPKWMGWYNWFCCQEVVLD